MDRLVDDIFVGGAVVVVIIW